MNITSQTQLLLKEQTQNWDLAKKNYLGLKKVKTKEFTLKGGALIKVQFNPERITSSSAKVDAKSINERPCFLCERNRPTEQLGVLFNNEYLILVNPFPIFPQHLTIPSNKHMDQLIEDHFSSMLELAKELPDFTIFYNGPKCGASAPDHFHFQAGNKGFMPIEEDFRNEKFTRLIEEKDKVEIYEWVNYHRSVITIKSHNPSKLSLMFKKLENVLNEFKSADENEPMFNILAYFEDGAYIVHVFLRALHRPDVFFEEGNKQILISPASVDMGGVFITPREKDFEEMSVNNIENILNQVCTKESTVKEIIKKLKS